MEKSLWRKLVYQWCEIDGRYGLTLPFLIGAEKEFGSGDGFDIDVLFKELQGSPQPYIISKCSDLDEYIVGLPKKEYPYLGSLTKYGSLYINSQDLDGLDSIDQIRMQLILLYEKPIGDNKYSKTIGFEEWTPFDDIDKSKIRTAMESL